MFAITHKRKDGSFVNEEARLKSVSTICNYGVLFTSSQISVINFLRLITWLIFYVGSTRYGS